MPHLNNKSQLETCVICAGWGPAAISIPVADGRCEQLLMYSTSATGTQGTCAHRQKKIKLAGIAGVHRCLDETC